MYFRTGFVFTLYKKVAFLFGLLLVFAASVEVSPATAQFSEITDLGGEDSSASALADFDQDGDLDAIVVGGFSTTVYKNTDTDGELDASDFSQVSTSLEDLDEASVAVGDLDGDSDPDLLVTGKSDAIGTSFSTILYENTDTDNDLQSGDFSEVTRFTGITNGSAKIEDLDGDGNPDLLFTGFSENNNFATFLYENNNTDATLSESDFSQISTDIQGASSSSISFGDLDGDGDSGLLLTGYDGESQATRIYENTDTNGDLESGDFSEISDLPIENVESFSGNGSSLGDLDQDGNPDLLITGKADNEPSPTAKIYENTNTGGSLQGSDFVEVSADLPKVELSSVFIGDIDDSGRSDLIVTGASTGSDTTAIYQNRDTDNDLTGGDISHAAGLTGVSSGSVSAGLLDDDSDLDLLVTGNGTAKVYETTRRRLDLVASATETVETEGQVGFGETGAEIDFSGISDTGEVTVEKFDTPPVDESIEAENVSDYRFVVEADDNLTFTDAEVRLGVSSLGGVSDPTGVTAYKRNVPGSGTFSALTPTEVDDNGTPNDISDDTLYASTDRFSEFVFASGPDNELPVELANFKGTTTGSSARLTWQTASETNNAGFEVQRQKEKGWAQVGYVDSEAQGGTTTETQSYSFAAEDLPVGTHRFRLKQVDLDGGSTLIDPFSVTIDMQEALKLIAPAPNPASTSASLSFAVKEQSETTITLYNTLGQQVATVYEGTPQAGKQQTARVDVSGLSSGAYFLRLQAGGQTRTQRLTVVR